MLPAPCYIISDAHLGVAPRASEHALTSFLRRARQDAKSLIINGDLFDFWFEWKSVIPRVGYRVLAEVAAFADAGIPVIWVAGNHDCWGGEFLREDAGVEYLLGPWRGEVAGWKVRVEHGDGLRGDADQRYRMVRPLLRNRAAIWAYRHLLHPDWSSRIALGTSATSRTWSAADKGEGLKKVAFRDLAAEPGLDLVVFGHSHVPTLVTSPTGGLYGNAGAWLGDSTYLRLVEEHVELFRWKGARGEPIVHMSRPLHLDQAQPST